MSGTRLQPGYEYVFFCNFKNCEDWDCCRKRIVFKISEDAPPRHLYSYKAAYFKNEIKWIALDKCVPDSAREEWLGEFCEL